MNFLKLPLLTILVLVMNTLDVVSTIHNIILGKIVEGNPLMQGVIDLYGLEGLLFFKIIFINLLIILLFINRKNEIAVNGILITSVIYSFVMIMHALI